MAIRNIRISTDEVLRKTCKPIKEITPNLLTLLDDMADTMYEANGVGLAAPQVGILKRAVVIDIGEGLVELLNPVILETSGSQTDEEGCRRADRGRRLPEPARTICPCGTPLLCEGKGDGQRGQ